MKPFPHEFDTAALSRAFSAWGFHAHSWRQNPCMSSPRAVIASLQIRRPSRILLAFLYGCPGHRQRRRHPAKPGPSSCLCSSDLSYSGKIICKIRAKLSILGSSSRFLKDFFPVNRRIRRELNNSEPLTIIRTHISNYAQSINKKHDSGDIWCLFPNYVPTSPKYVPDCPDCLKMNTSGLLP